MKKNYLILILICWANLIFCQNYYYYRNQQQNLTLDKTGFDIYVNNIFLPESVSDTNLKPFILNDLNSDEKTGSVEFINTPTDTEYFSIINELKTNENVLSVQPRFITAEEEILRLSDYAFVKLKNSSDLSILQNLATTRNFSIIGPNQFMPLWYKIKCDKNTSGNSLETANFLAETGYFAASNPDFLTSDTEENEQVTAASNPDLTNCANDTNFGDLWGLRNNTFPNIDINVCNAWTISQGERIKVAVLDAGIDLNNLDLKDNILPLSFNTVTGTSPSQAYTYHGTFVAGIIGAIKDNNYQIAGVAPKSKLFSISTDGANTLKSVEQRAKGISWAWQNGADIINNSWRSIFYSDLLEDAICDALTNGRNGLGTIVIFNSGNYDPLHTVGSPVKYPANSHDLIIAVGAVDINGSRGAFSCYGSELDVVAPGVNILSTVFNNALANTSGTSFAAPHVAGICALILSVNPCLSVKQVNDIIERTAKKTGSYSYANTGGRPNGTWNNEMGYGLADAYEAVKLAQQMMSPGLDLYIKDSEDDFGTEPNTATPYIWVSDNIWIRNANDSGPQHQNPVYNNAGIPNFVNVRVINKSCTASVGNDQLKLYWAKSSTGLSYPDPWNGGIYHPVTGAEMGNIVGTLNIPVLQPGEETVLTLPWVVPNPANYGSGGDEWRFSLLARIESSNDPMSVAETADLNSNVRNNNNIAWKNITVVMPDLPTGIVAIANPFNTPKTYYLEFLSDDLEAGSPIYEEAEVSIKMDGALYNAWERGGKGSHLLSPTLEENKKIVGGNNVILDNISFNPNEAGTLRLGFNFLTRKSTQKSEFRYHLIQKDAETGQVIGGETFIINKNQRALFEANAGEAQAVNANESITLNAEDIQETATYNWYDSEGNLIHQGKSLQIPHAVAEKYRLEVISSLDGFKDYAEAEVKLKPGSIQSIAPNPARDSILVNYTLNGAGSAYLIIIGYNNTTSNNYILDVSSNQTSINISNYPAGYYTVALAVNGEITDVKTLIKQ